MMSYEVINSETDIGEGQMLENKEDLSLEIHLIYCFLSFFSAEWQDKFSQPNCE